MTYTTATSANRTSIGLRLVSRLIICVCVCFASCAALADDSYEVIKEFDQPILLSKNVRLSANIFRPDSDGRFPVIISRTPYGKQLSDGTVYAKSGYVYISIDVRGRYDSAGTFYPYKTEGKDGAKIIEWAAKQSWSDGNIGTMGGSYAGFSQWLAARETPKSLKAMFILVSPSDYYDSPAHTGGAFNLAGRLPWAALTDARTNQVLSAHDWESAFLHLPVIDADNAIGRDLDAYRDWVSHPTKNGYWSDFSMEDHWGDVEVPVYHLGGWYDEFIRGTLQAYSSMRKEGGNDLARSNQRLLIGPWTHAVNSNRQVGDVDFGDASLVPLRQEMLAWFDQHLKGKTAPEEPARVRVFVMGTDRWADFADWPAPNTAERSWYFHSGGNANTRDGDGRLSDVAPEIQPHDSFVYDPNDPTPTVGGGTCCVIPGMYPEILAWGPWDQRDVEMREDVLVYTSQALKEDVTVVGGVTVELYASSSAPDTDFTAKLVDVSPDGYAKNLTDGIIRARYRKSVDRPELIEPGEVYKYTIDLAATANTFKAGHKIRVEISSSNFPWYDRNLNTGGDLARGDEINIANQKIFHEQARPSRIIMRVLSADELNSAIQAVENMQ